MKDLSLHILDIVENSIHAGSTKIEISITEDTKKNKLLLKIRDNGKGLNKEALLKVRDPFYTTKKIKKVGLGIPMLAQTAKEAGGNIKITSKEGKGTTISATFAYDHIDRKPIGNMPETIISLILSGGNQTDFIYKHRKDGNLFIFNTGDIKKKLQGMPITNPDVLGLIKKELKKELKNI